MAALARLRHEKFCRQYVICGNMAEAYRKVYPHVKPITTAKANGWRLIRTRRDIQDRLDELLRPFMKRSDITIESVLSDYEEAKQMARDQGKSGELREAATAQAKLVGHLKDRVETTNINFEGMDDKSEIIDAVAQKDPVMAQKLMELFDLMPVTETNPEPSVKELEAIEPVSKAVN